MKKLVVFIVCFLSVTGSVISAQDFVAHEWGTFTTLQTSNGQMLEGLQTDEETLPQFVYALANIDNTGFESTCYLVHRLFGHKVERHNYDMSSMSCKGFKGVSGFNDVTVKMETPVIYFYSPEEKEVNVKVNFPNGTISEWYPERTDGEPLIDNSTIMIDLAKPTEGFIEWDATVLAPDNQPAYTNAEEQETEQWIRPRATAANLLQASNGEIEKFLFYRGIANLDMPLRVEFNYKEELLLTNNYEEDIAYALVYDKKEGLPANVWWSGAIPANCHKLIPQPDIQITEQELENYMQQFEDKLVEAGLYQDEAKSMLATWQESYFEHPGLKVFWVLPRSLTDAILPIDITPVPDKMERVLVGRSEILFPEEEQSILEIDDPIAFAENYIQDRFFHAFNAFRMQKGIKGDYSMVDSDCQSKPPKNMGDLLEKYGTPASNNNSTTFPNTKKLLLNGSGKTSHSLQQEAESALSIYLLPNPFQNDFRLQGKSSSEEMEILIFNIFGQEVKRLQAKVVNKHFSEKISLPDLSSGTYFIKVSNGWESRIKKIVKAN